MLNKFGLLKASSRKYRRKFEVNSQEQIQVREKNWYQQVDYMQVPNWMGPSVWRSKRPWK